MQWLRDIWEWFTGALAAVYEKDGLLGITVIVGLLIAIVVLLGYGLWFFGVDVAGWFE